MSQVPGFSKTHQYGSEFGDSYHAPVVPGTDLPDEQAENWAGDRFTVRTEESTT